MNRQFNYIERKIHYENEIIRNMMKSVNQYKRIQKSAFIMVCTAVLSLNILALGFIIKKIDGNPFLFLLTAVFTIITGYLEGKCLKSLHIKFDHTFRSHFKDKLEAIDTAQETIDFLRSQMIKKYHNKQ